MFRSISAAGICVACAFAAQADPPPLEAYGKLPAIERAAISPDGAHLAFIVTDGEKRNIIIQQTSDLKTIDFLKAGDTRVRSIKWAVIAHAADLGVTAERPSRCRGGQAGSGMAVPASVRRMASMARSDRRRPVSTTPRTSA